jgi:hypothetical protein
MRKRSPGQVWLGRLTTSPPRAKKFACYMWEGYTSFGGTFSVCLLAARAHHLFRRGRLRGNLSVCLFAARATMSFVAARPCWAV